MPAWNRTSVRAIILAAVARIVEITELDAARVGVTVLPPDEVPPFGAPQDVLVRVRGETPDEGIIDGTGRWDNRRRRILDVACRTRVSLDEEGGDLARLTHESLGHVLLEDLVVEALEIFNAPDPDEAGSLITAPLRVGRLTDPQRMAKFPDWVFSVFTVEAEYSRDLDTDLSSQFATGH